MSAKKTTKTRGQADPKTRSPKPQAAQAEIPTPEATAAEPAPAGPAQAEARTTEMRAVAVSPPPAPGTEVPDRAKERTTSRAARAKGGPDGAAAKTRKLSALDAAAKVLGEAGQAMTCPELIAAMAAKGYWTSPGGKTPQATLYAAILREITVKGTHARFRKTERGKFARTGVV